MGLVENVNERYRIKSVNARIFLVQIFQLLPPNGA